MPGQAAELLRPQLDGRVSTLGWYAARAEAVLKPLHLPLHRQVGHVDSRRPTQVVWQPHHEVSVTEAHRASLRRLVCLPVRHPES